MREIVRQSVVVIIALWLLKIVSLYFDGQNNEVSDDDKDLICMEDRMNFINICRPQCTHGYYSLPGMRQCEPWLTCSEIKKEIEILEPLTHGAVKMVYKARMKGNIVVYSKLRTSLYQEDFQHGLAMLTALQPSHHVTQLLGFCQDSFVTEYHSLGTAELVNDLLNGPMAIHNNLETRFGLCINYVEMIGFLHSSPIGTRVMCDSNDIDKTLSQFLVNPDLTLVVNDLDALPEVTDGQGIKCGHRQLFGDFVAPEQLWPYGDVSFSDDLMPGYDEKTDIWKIPNMCNYFLGDSNEASLLQFHLYQIHKQCKDRSPEHRPSALEVLNAYHEIKVLLGL